VAIAPAERESRLPKRNPGLELSAKGCVLARTAEGHGPARDFDRFGKLPSSV